MGDACIQAAQLARLGQVSDRRWPADQPGPYLKHGAARGRHCARRRSQRGRPRRDQESRTSRHHWRSDPDRPDLRRQCEMLRPYYSLTTEYLLLFTNYLLATYCLLLIPY